MEENGFKAIFNIKWLSSMRVKIKLLHSNAKLEPLIVRNEI